MVFFDVVSETDIACSTDICDDVQPPKNRSPNSNDGVAIKANIDRILFKPLTRPLQIIHILVSHKNFIEAFLSLKGGMEFYIMRRLTEIIKVQQRR